MLVKPKPKKIWFVWTNKYILLLDMPDDVISLLEGSSGISSEKQFVYFAVTKAILQSSDKGFVSQNPKIYGLFEQTNTFYCWTCQTMLYSY